MSLKIQNLYVEAGDILTFVRNNLPELPPLNTFKKSMYLKSVSNIFVRFLTDTNIIGLENRDMRSLWITLVHTLLWCCGCCFDNATF